MFGVPSRKNISEVLIIGVLLVVLILHYSGIFLGFDIEVLVISTLIGVIPVFLGALKALKEREWASMDMLASVAQTEHVTKIAPQGRFW